MAGRRDEGGYLTARVIEANRLSPSLIRVVFDASDACGFESSGVPDEIVHLYFPADGEDVPPEMIRRDGVLAHHDDVVRECRNYTVRCWDGDRITIDFVDHVGGVAADWARSAEPGTALGMWGTRSWYEPPADTEWMLLIADLPGLPAVCRARAAACRTPRACDRRGGSRRRRVGRSIGGLGDHRLAGGRKRARTIATRRCCAHVSSSDRKRVRLVRW